MGAIGEPKTGKADFDIDARERQVIGDGPRIAPLSEDSIPAEAEELINQIRAVFKIPDEVGIPSVSLITLRHPGLFRGQMSLGIELAGNGAIPHRERELAVLRIAMLCGAPFEWAEHVDIARKFGVTDEEIERVVEGSSAAGWSEHERALLRGVEELIADRHLSDETWDTLARTWNEKQLMELPILVGSYFMTALQQNTLRVPPKAGFRYRG